MALCTNDCKSYNASSTAGIDGVTTLCKAVSSLFVRWCQTCMAMFSTGPSTHVPLPLPESLPAPRIITGPFATSRPCPRILKYAAMFTLLSYDSYDNCSVICYPPSSVVSGLVCTLFSMPRCMQTLLRTAEMQWVLALSVRFTFSHQFASSSLPTLF